jgi:fructose-1,6-bisphosphatase II / sedoheptulose-1,7-bisphosphatase
MRRELNKLPIHGTVVIGEGERDEAPMLFIGEEVGARPGRRSISRSIRSKAPRCAPSHAGRDRHHGDGRGRHAAQRARRLHGEDRDRPGYPKGVVDLDAPAEQNIRNLAKAKGVQPAGHHRADPGAAAPCRHHRGGAQDRRRGALITDGDVAGRDPHHRSRQTGIDIYLGSAGRRKACWPRPRLRCIGGQMQCRLVLDTEEKRDRAAKMGIKDPRKKYEIEDMVRGDCLFAATGVTDGSMLPGVKFRGDVIETETVVMRSVTGTVRWIRAEHRQLEKFHLD